MIEVNCKECSNYSTEGCKCYGNNIIKALNDCAEDNFKNYKITKKDKE